MGSYLLLTIDVEALAKRARTDHVQLLVWGRHANGTAGVREICGIGAEFGVKHVCFVDLCATLGGQGEMGAVVRWLVQDGQDVQLHAHPEVLPASFWQTQGLSAQPALMNEYVDSARAEFVLRHFGGALEELTGQRIRAFRAGSFRWNAHTLRALGRLGVPLSFNNSMRAFRAGQCPFSVPTAAPFRWSNGVVELPLAERLLPPTPTRPERWASLTYPPSAYFSPLDLPRPTLWQRFMPGAAQVTVLLLHSWSFLYWDENGHATYRDDARLEGYRKLLARLTKDYDVITTKDFLDLLARGKIKTSHTVDVAQAELQR